MTEISTRLPYSRYKLRAKYFRIKLKYQKNQIKPINFEIVTILKMSDETNLLEVLAVAAGVDNVGEVDNPLPFDQCKDLGELYYLIKLISK